MFVVTPHSFDTVANAIRRKKRFKPNKKMLLTVMFENSLREIKIDIDHTTTTVYTLKIKIWSRCSNKSSQFVARNQILTWNGHLLNDEDFIASYNFDQTEPIVVTSTYKPQPEQNYVKSLNHLAYKFGKMAIHLSTSNSNSNNNLKIVTVRRRKKRKFQHKMIIDDLTEIELNLNP